MSSPHNESCTSVDEKEIDKFGRKFAFAHNKKDNHQENCTNGERCEK